MRITRLLPTLSVLGLVLLARPLPSSASASETLADGVEQLKTAIGEQYSELSDEQQTELYTTRHDTIVTAIETTQAAVYDAKEYVVWILALNVKQKQFVYALLTDLYAQLELYKKQVNDINALYTSGDYSEDTANAELTEIREDLVEWLKDNTDTFGENIRAILINNLDASLAYTGAGIDALTRAEEAYEELGENTTKLAQRLKQANAAYEKSQTYYDTGIADDDVKQLQLATRRIIVARALFTGAQQQANKLEQIYLPEEETEEDAEETEV